MRTVISLTTIPSRHELLLRTLRSLACQSIQPDAVYLCLPTECRREPGRPYKAVTSEFPNVTVISGCVDYGPATKLMPTLERETDPTTLVVTADDDIEYAPEWLSRLVAGSDRFPDVAVGFCGWNAGLLILHGMYDLLYEDRSDIPDGISADVLEGWRGILYRRGFFGDDVQDFCRRLPVEARLVDDVWVAGYLARRGVKRRVVRYGEARLTPEQAAQVWKNHGGAPEANGLVHIGSALERNRRVAAVVFRKG